MSSSMEGEFVEFGHIVFLDGPVEVTDRISSLSYHHYE